MCVAMCEIYIHLIMMENNFGIVLYNCLLITLPHYIIELLQNQLALIQSCGNMKGSIYNVTFMQVSPLLQYIPW